MIEGSDFTPPMITVVAFLVMIVLVCLVTLACIVALLEVARQSSSGEATRDACGEKFDHFFLKFLCQAVRAQRNSPFWKE